MNLTLAPCDGYVLASVAGSIDSTTADDFASRVRPVVENQDTDLLIDLSETDYVNSDALAEFIQLRDAAERHSRRLVLISPQPLVRQILSTTRLDTILDVVDHLDEAVASVERNSRLSLDKGR